MDSRLPMTFGAIEDPVHYEERAELARFTSKTLGFTMPALVDEIDDAAVKKDSARFEAGLLRSELVRESMFIEDCDGAQAGAQPGAQQGPAQKRVRNFRDPLADVLFVYDEEDWRDTELGSDADADAASADTGADAAKPHRLCSHAHCSVGTLRTWRSRTLPVWRSELRSSRSAAESRAGATASVRFAASFARTFASAFAFALSAAPPSPFAPSGSRRRCSFSFSASIRSAASAA